MILSFKGKEPRIGKSTFIAENSTVIGDVEIGSDASIWFNTVIRGDVHHIRIDDGTNVQDGTVIHVNEGTNPTIIGKNVTIGHRAIIHSCTIKDEVLVGINAVVLDDVVVESGSLIAAGAVVLPGTHIESNVLAAGIPAKIKRALTKDEIESIRLSAEHYIELKKFYLSNEVRNVDV